MTMTSEKAENIVSKFETFGLTRLAATECLLVATIYEAFFENTVHDEQAAAALTQAAVASIIANTK